MIILSFKKNGVKMKAINWILFKRIKIIINKNYVILIIEVGLNKKTIFFPKFRN